MGEHGPAIRELEAILVQQPDDGQAHYQLGLSYAATGRKDEAIREIQRALTYQNDPKIKQEMEQKLIEIRNGK